MSIFEVAVVIGLLLPLICLLLVWKVQPARFFVLLYIGLQIAQIATERFLALSGRRDLIKYAASCFVCVRLMQLWYGRKKIASSASRSKFEIIVWATYILNICLWTFIFIRLFLRIVQNGWGA